jgi:hypothetical protein
MAKKPPKLILIGSEQPGPRPSPLDPPVTLGPVGRELWGRIHRDFVVDDASGLEMLFQVCSAADLASDYAATIARDGGPAVRTKSGIKEHPLVRHELAARSFVVRSLHRLGFDVVAPRNELGRPSGDGAYRGENQ